LPKDIQSEAHTTQQMLKSEVKSEPHSVKSSPNKRSEETNKIVDENRHKDGRSSLIKEEALKSIEIDNNCRSEQKDSSNHERDKMIEDIENWSQHSKGSSKKFEKKQSQSSQDSKKKQSLTRKSQTTEG